MLIVYWMGAASVCTVAFSIEIHYGAEGYSINCDLMVLFTEDSLPKLTELLHRSKE